MKWHTEKRKISELIPHQQNPRQMTEKQVKDLTESLKKFDLAEIPAINTNNKILAGHQRLKILSLLGRQDEEIDVRVPDRLLTEQEETEYLLRSNKNTGEWDWDMLANFDIDFLKDVGFVSEELDKIFTGGGNEDKEELKDEEVVSKLGEVYQLGMHKLVCGDSTDPEVYKKLFAEGEKAQLIYTDPPYNVGYDYTVTQVEGRARKSPFETFNDSRSDVEFTTFIYDVFSLAFPYLKDNGAFYCYHATMTSHLFREAILKAGFHISQTLIWLKDRPTFSKGLDYLYITEPIFFGWKKGNKHYYNRLYSLDFENILKTSREDFPLLLDALYQERENTEEYLHPTQKPINLANTPVIRHSERDSIVLDMFGGSGSTLLACERLGRICYTIELDPKFADVIRRRYAKEIGKEEEWQTITKAL